MDNDFVDFTGDENEIEFLEKCLKQWEITANNEKLSEPIKLCQVGSVFSEMRHRLEELKEE